MKKISFVILLMMVGLSSACDLDDMKVPGVDAAIEAVDQNSALSLENNIKIYAVKYGKSMMQKKAIFYGDTSTEKVQISWLFYYIEYGDKKILIDTGQNNWLMTLLYWVTDFRDPVAVLNDNNIAADQITDIIITHSHFDHVGCVSSFKNARIIINRDELAGLKSNNAQITVFDESMTLYDFFRIKKVGGHTKGSSVVFFSNKGSEYCFVGDEVYLMDNIEKGIGNATVVNHVNNIDFIDLLRNNEYIPFVFHDKQYAEMNGRFIKVFPAE